MSEEVLRAAKEYPVVTLMGPRQSGKTTLVRHMFPQHGYRSLEDPDVRARAQADPRGFLAALADGGILDEVQKLPDIPSYLQGIVDSDRRPGRFILTGSHQPQVHQAISQSLAGRTAVLELYPFSFERTGCLRGLSAACGRQSGAVDQVPEATPCTLFLSALLSFTLRC